MFSYILVSCRGLVFLYHMIFSLINLLYLFRSGKRNMLVWKLCYHTQVSESFHCLPWQFIIWIIHLFIVSFILDKIVFLFFQIRLFGLMQCTCGFVAQNISTVGKLKGRWVTWQPCHWLVHKHLCCCVDRTQKATLNGYKTVSEVVIIWVIGLTTCSTIFGNELEIWSWERDTLLIDWVKI